MANYFLTQLYGGDEFKLLAKQLERILPKAKKLERLAKESALKTATMAIESAILSIELDMHLAQWLIAHDKRVNEEDMLAAYRGIDESAERYIQISHLKDVCYRTDKYLNSFVLRKAFAFSKGAAYRHHYQPLYDFIDAGFNAMKPLSSIGNFIDSFCVRETKLIDQIHAADNVGKISAFTVS